MGVCGSGMGTAGPGTGVTGSSKGLGQGLVIGGMDWSCCRGQGQCLAFCFLPAWCSPECGYPGARMGAGAPLQAAALVALRA